MSSVWSLDQVLALREAIRSRPAATGPQRDERYHAAAAVVTSFTFDPSGHRDEAGANLETDSIPLDPIDPRRRTLKNDVRTRVLAGFAEKRALIAVLESIAARPSDLVQKTFEAWLMRGELAPIESQSSDELTATLQIVDWFSSSPLSRELPGAEAVRARVGHAALFDPLRNLVGEHFRGRKVELGVMESYVEGAGERPPLLIYGPGGMGKSTLLAKFFLDYIRRADVVYLDCDRPGLVAEEPLTLLAEAVRQLGLQHPGVRTAAERLRARWLDEIARGREGTSTRAPSAGDRHAQDFRILVRDLRSPPRGLLFVVDTFEEVQYRSQAAVAEVFALLSRLRPLLPELRAIIAGRNPVPRFESLPLELGELDEESSAAFLEASGVGSEPVRRKLSRLLRGNPLTLQLAADILRRGTPAELDELEALADDTAIQGVLYARILGHIHDEDVKKIAHPGLILRYVTADIIRRVLAGPCGIAVGNEKRAADLFARLRQELSLVVPEGDAVRHRSDVRRVMLQALRKDQRDKVRRIEEAAVRYYAEREDDVSRAEEIYHRLSLGEAAAQVEGRWRKGIEDSLRSALDDLQGGARAYLASKLGVELYDENWDSAEQTTWEEYAARKADELLRLDRPLEALRLMRRRTARLPESPLHWFHAQALHRTGQRLEAREVARQAIAAMLGDLAWPGSEAEPRAEAATAIDWFTGPQCSAPPSKDTVRREVALAGLLAPMRALASRSFVGRKKELDALEQYVWSGLSPQRRAPLLVYGPGGSGKSTLVARFVLDCLERIALVHIDCEHLDLGSESRSDPLDDVILRAVRQLAAQFPEFATAAHLLSETVRPGPAAEVMAGSGHLLEFFLEHMRRLERHDRFLLFVFDHFEAMLYRSQAYAEQVRRFLDRLTESIPRVRAIVIARTAAPGLNFDMLAVGRLDAEATNAFLAAEGIEDPLLRRRILELVEGSPYALRLAVDLIKREGPAAIQSLQAGAGDLTGYLSNRILSHIHDEDARRIAHAALVLRRVTPGIIREVLSPAAGVNVDSDERAMQLFASLRNEVSLFTIEGDELRLRSEVRRALLAALRQRDPAFLRAVGEAAVRYYASRSELQARAEEVYHRLLLGQSAEEIDARWLPGFERDLDATVEELEGPAKAYLAARLGLELADIDWTGTDQRTWERYAAARARALLNVARHLEAVELLRQRSARLPGSPLFALEAEALLHAGQPRDALLVARKGLELAPDDAALAEVIKACERALGSEQTLTPSTPARASRTFHLRSGVGPEALADALAQALPTATDVLNALSSLPGPLRATLSGGEPRLPELVAHAMREDRVDALVTAAAAYAPDAPALHDLIEEELEVRAHDPFSQVWFESRPLFDRQVLREFLSNLAHPKPRYKALAIDGPRGSGKSYTAEFVNHVAKATGLFDVGTCRIVSGMAVSDISTEIFSLFGWRIEDAAPQEESPGRAARRAAGQIAARARLHPRKILVFFDVERTEQPLLAPDVLDFLIALADYRDGPPVILAGIAPGQLPSQLAPNLMVEALGPLAREDIDLGLRRIEIELGFERGVLQGRPLPTQGVAAESYNRAVNDSVRQFVYALTRPQS